MCRRDQARLFRLAGAPGSSCLFLSDVAVTVVATVISRFGLIDFECAPVQVLPVEFFFGRLSRGIGVHLDEAEALRAIRRPVEYQITGSDHTDLAKQAAKFIISRFF